jgi:hypothetical protein
VLTRPEDIVAYYQRFVQEHMQMAAAAQSAQIRSLLSESDLLWRMANQSLLATLLGHIKRELVDGADQSGARQHGGGDGDGRGGVVVVVVSKQSITNGLRACFAALFFTHHAFAREYVRPCVRTSMTLAIPPQPLFPVLSSTLSVPTTAEGELNATIRSTAARFDIDFPQDVLRASSTLSVAIVGSNPLTGEPTTTEVPAVHV